MNRAVVRRAAAGLAAWLTEHGPAGAPVVVGFDARHGSLDFARDSAAIFAAAGFDGPRCCRGCCPRRCSPSPCSTCGAAAGVMVTASHNPPQDNGYKVYAGDGAQIVPPADAEIEAAIRAVGPTREIPLDARRRRSCSTSELVDAYVAAIVGPGRRPARATLRIVHTAMHGVGSAVLRAVFDAAGFTDVVPVPQQEQPDPDFPTVAFPNPEEPGALDLAFALARERDADLIIANDPDADRCAVAVPDRSGGWRMLRGDEVGVLLADALLRARGPRHVRDDDRVVVDARRRWPARTASATPRRSPGSSGSPAPRPISSTATRRRWATRSRPTWSATRTASARPCAWPCCAAELKAAGSSLLQRLDELAAEHGRYATDQVVDPGRRPRRHRRRRCAGCAPPRRPRCSAAPVTVEDLLPDADVLRWRVPHGARGRPPVGHRAEAEGLPGGRRAGRLGGDGPGGG